jgi:hypothetical protein
MRLVLSSVIYVTIVCITVNHSKFLLASLVYATFCGAWIIARYKTHDFKNTIKMHVDIKKNREISQILQSIKNFVSITI